MVKRNQNLERKSLSMLLQLEERRLQEQMKEKQQLLQQQQQHPDDDYDDEDEDEMDEDMMKAIELSKQESKKHQQMNLMNSTAGFNMAIQMSLNETSGQPKPESKMTEKERMEKEEEEQMRIVMEMSKANQQMEMSIKEREEMELKMVMEASKQQEEQKQEMIKQNNRLEDMMKKIEDEKPQGWGIKKIGQEGLSDQETLNIYQQNFNKALNKIELEDKINTLKQEQKPSTTQEILEQTNMGDETNEERMRQLKIAKEKLIAQRNEGRNVELLRDTMSKLDMEANKAKEVLSSEKEKQNEKLEQMRQSRMEKMMSKSSMSMADLIEDNYDGFDDKKGEISDEKEGPRILDDDFLDNLKVVDVPDSDDEVYF